MLKSALKLLISGLLLLATASAAFASGTKLIQNVSPMKIAVKLVGRAGSNPTAPGLPPVYATIEPYQTLNVTYGNNSNPYLNSLEVIEASNGSDVRQKFKAAATGGPGTLDNLFNTNSTLILTFQPATYDFALTGSNN